MLYVISYDIEDDRRRNRIARYLEALGQRVQYSVFECELTPAQHRAVRVELEERIDRMADSVRLYPVCATCAAAIERLGAVEPIRHDQACVIF